jgi:hypothetical protein
LFAAPDDAPPNVNPPPVFDAPKPVFVAVLVFVLNGLLVVFVAPKPPDVLPPPKSEPPVFDAPKLGVAGLFWPNSPGKVSEFDFDSIALGGCSIPPLVLPPNPPPVLVVVPNPPPLLPKPPDVAVLPPNSPPPVLVVFDAPKAVLLPPNGELLFVFGPKPPNPPDVAVLPPNSEPPVEALVLEPKPPPVFELPKPPKVLCCWLLPPKPKDMLAVAEVEFVREEVACAGRY